MMRLLCWTGVVWTASVAFAPSVAFAQASDPPAEASPSQGHIVLVTGASGTQPYAEQFALWAESWQAAAAKSKMTLDSVGPVKLADRDEAESSDDEMDDKARLKQRLEEAEAESATPLWLVMIGHGTFARNVAKFNLEGPDVSATELAKWLERFQRPVVVVNTASSSGPFVNRLSSPGRVIVTATRSGTEQNFARFGRYFAEAIASAESDLDHDDEVSVQEAFLRASAQVKAFYESQGRLATEHALIDDNADGKGTPATMFRGTRAIAEAKDGATLDGAVASKITLAPSGSRLPFTEEELKRRSELEAELERQRARKDERSQQEHDAAIEPILIELAKLYQTAENRARENETDKAEKSTE